MIIYEEDKDYKFIPYDEQYACVQLLDGEYEGTVYMYGNISFEDKENDEVYMTFNYEILESDLDKSILEQDDDFKQHIGDILSSIMIKKLDENKGIHELGTIDFKESDSK